MFLWKEAIEVKPRVKNDSWCYTTSKRAAREKVKRLTNKRHRRDNKKIINGEGKLSVLFKPL